MSEPWLQPTLRLIGGGNAAGGKDTRHRGVSTHPPPHRRREPGRRAGRRWRLGRFNPPSASSAEGTLEFIVHVLEGVAFQPTLRLIGGGNSSATMTNAGSSWFQPTLRLIGGGNSLCKQCHTLEELFQPTLRLIGGGNTSCSGRRPCSTSFQPTLRLIGGGNRPRPPRRDPGLVSTHPPPHRRREPEAVSPPISSLAFQPTLRLIGGGNSRRLRASRQSLVSTHPPPHRRRERRMAQDGDL